jgi:hypothetical protein
VLRKFAVQHAAAHAKTATVRSNAACHCRAQECATHPAVKVTQCSGGVVLVLRHDPSVGQVWTLAEVCEACAPLMTHTTVLVRVPRHRPATPQPAAQAAVPHPSSVPGGFSSQGAGGGADGGGEEVRRRPRRGSRSHGRGGRSPRQAR